MATSITISVIRSDVYTEVEKATDYIGAKLIDGDENARDRIVAGDSDLSNLGRFWTEAANQINERFKAMLMNSADSTTSHQFTLEVSKSYDTALNGSVQSLLQSYFIAFIIGQWFRFANKGESANYFMEAEDLLTSAERLLYSRKKPSVPTRE